MMTLAVVLRLDREYSLHNEHCALSAWRNEQIIVLHI